MVFGKEAIVLSCSNSESVSEIWENSTGSDYTAWVIGKNAEANTARIRNIVDHALAWKSSSGVTFKGEKTALVYFVKNPRLQGSSSLYTRSVEVRLQEEAKVLCVIMDSGLHFNQPEV